MIFKFKLLNLAEVLFSGFSNLNFNTLKFKFHQLQFYCFLKLVFSFSIKTADQLQSLPLNYPFAILDWIFFSSTLFITFHHEKFPPLNHFPRDYFIWPIFNLAYLHHFHCNLTCNATHYLISCLFVKDILQIFGSSILIHWNEST